MPALEMLLLDWTRLNANDPTSANQRDADLGDVEAQPSSNMKKARAMEPEHRRERGLVEYQQCGVNELRSFVLRHGLQGVPKRASKKKCRTALEAADDQLVFSQFEELPPEIRGLIYEYHLDSLEKP